MENRLLPEGKTGGLARAQAYDVPTAEYYVEQESPSLLVEYWRILRRRRGTVLLVTFLCALAAALYTLPQTPVYQARTTLEVQGINENFLNMGSVNPTTPEGYSPFQDIQTQIKILQSESLAERALKKLGPRKAPVETGRVSAWRRALGLTAPARPCGREAAVRVVTESLKVRTSGQTRIIEILYDSTDPREAARFANVLANEFIEQNLEARWQTTQRTSDFLARQLEDLKIKLEKSEEALQRYATQSGLLFTGEKQNVADEKLRQLQEELLKGQAERVAKQSRYEMAASTAAEALPDVLDDTNLRSYQGRLTELRQTMADLTSALTPEHPKVKRVQAQIEEVERSLERERGNILKRIRADYEAAGRREKLLAAAYGAQSRLVSDQGAKSIQYNILKREVDTTRQLYEAMLQKVKEAGIASAMRASNIRVVDAAEVPEEPYRPKLVLNAGLGVMAGLCFGVVLVIALERADRRVQGPGEAQYWLNVAELGVIPAGDARPRRLYSHHRGAEDTEKSAVELATWKARPSQVAEGFHATLASILFMGQNGDRPRVIVLTSPNPREGKTTVASNLALAMADVNQRVLLIDADMRRPRLHEVFGAKNDWGLSDLLRGKLPPEGSGLIVTGHERLALLPAGTETAGVSSLLHSPRMGELLRKMKQEFDAVVIDTPPMLQLPDARVLGKLADGVILVVRANQTMRDSAQAATQRLMEDGSVVLGTVLNDWDQRKSGGYGYGYGYGYGPYYYRPERTRSDAESAEV